MIGLPERTQDDTIVFTMFIITDMIQARSITDRIIIFQSGSVFSLLGQADGRSI